MSNRYLLGAGVALAMALGVAQAQAQFFGPYPPGAFYLGPEGGWTQLTSQTTSVTFNNGPQHLTASRSATADFDAGFNAGVRGGYLWGPWRFEEEYSYRYNSVSSFGGSHQFSGGNNSFHSNAIMTNVIYDFTLGWPITPHIGGGVGAVDVFRSVGGTFTVPAPINATVSPTLTNDKWHFGYQAIAGIRYFINPALALDIDYRYFATPGNETATAFRLTPVGGKCCLSASASNIGYKTQNVVASLTMMLSLIHI